MKFLWKFLNLHTKISMENWFSTHYLFHLPGDLSFYTPLEHTKTSGVGGGCYRDPSFGMGSFEFGVDRGAVLIPVFYRFWKCCLNVRTYFYCLEIFKISHSDYIKFENITLDMGPVATLIKNERKNRIRTGQFRECGKL